MPIKTIYVLCVLLAETKKMFFFKVVFPSATPYIIDALKINVGLSFVGVIVGEFLCC